MRRRVIFAPMRPRPTIPNCMLHSFDCDASRPSGVTPALCEKLTQCCLNRRCELPQSRAYIAPQMHPQRATTPFGQYLEIPARLRRLHHPECVLLLRHRQLDGVVACDLQEDARIWSAFVGLTRGMQKSRSKAQAGRYMLFVAHTMSQRLQHFLVLVVHLDISEHSKVIACTNTVEMRL